MPACVAVGATLTTPPPPAPPPPPCTRTPLQVSSALNTLAAELTRSVDQVNDLAAASLGDPATPMGSVVRVLNGQLQALSQLEGRIGELGAQLDVLRVA